MNHYYKCSNSHWCRVSNPAPDFNLRNKLCSKCKNEFPPQTSKYYPPSIGPYEIIGTLLDKKPMTAQLGSTSGHANNTDAQPLALGASKANMNFNFALIQSNSPQSTLEEKVEANKEIDNQLHRNHVQQVTKTESMSQIELYKPLAEKNYLFLARDLTFKPFKMPTSNFAPDETIPEPGLSIHGTYTTRTINQQCLGIGRLETIKDDGCYIKNTFTYPDYLVQKDKRIYAIELKTPRNTTFKKYLSEHFWAEKIFDGSSLKEELERRRTIIHKDIDQVVIFDLSNIQSTDPLKELWDHIKSSTIRREWYDKNINRYMFYGFNGVSFKAVTTGEIEAATKHKTTTGTSKLPEKTQPSLYKYFTQDKK